MQNRTMRIRPDLRATLNEGSGLVIERSSAAGAGSRIMLKPDEWQELMDWILAVRLLSRGGQGSFR